MGTYVQRHFRHHYDFGQPHKILRANKAMADALGMTELDLIGKPCFELVHGERGTPVFCPHTQLLTDGEEHSAEVAELVSEGYMTFECLRWLVKMVRS